MMSLRKNNDVSVVLSKAGRDLVQIVGDDVDARRVLNMVASGLLDMDGFVSICWLCRIIPMSSYIFSVEYMKKLILNLQL